MQEADRREYQYSLESTANNIYEAIVLMSDDKIRRITALIGEENPELAEALEKKLF